jgi:hypothetical protein
MVSWLSCVADDAKDGCLVLILRARPDTHPSIRGSLTVWRSNSILGLAQGEEKDN